MRTLWTAFWSWLRPWLTGQSHVAIGGRRQPYMLRWYVWPRNRWCNLYLHRFCRSDDDRALHDHPWNSLSLILRGYYIEHTAQGRRFWSTGSLILRRAHLAHRIELVDGRPCWTLFATGPKVRNWGFWCPRGWVPWQEFTDPADSSAVGKGCDEFARVGSSVDGRPQAR